MKGSPSICPRVKNSLSTHIIIVSLPLRAGSDISKTSSSTRGLIKLRGFSVKSDSDSGIDGDSLVGEIRIKQVRHHQSQLLIYVRNIFFPVFLMPLFSSRSPDINSIILTIQLIISPDSVLPFRDVNCRSFPGNLI